MSFRCALSQETIPEDPIYKNMVEIRHDNDFLMFTDRYYTTGNFIGWRRLLKQKNISSDKKQYRLFIQQEIYTPADLLETDIKKFDRPFAGFLGLTNGLTLTNTRRLLDIQLTIGITGPYSGAEGLQTAFHKNAFNSRTATWLGQIKTSAYGNLYTSYTREWNWQPNPFSVYFALSPKAAFGNRDIYFQQEAAFYFGRRSSIQTTSAYQQIGNTQNEYFFVIRLAYRYIVHDALLEGNLIGDSSPFLIDPYSNMFLYNFEFYTRLKRHNIKFTYNFRSPETRRTFPHLYFTITLSRSF
jgi:lipid A 3-O-deacylase